MPFDILLHGVLPPVHFPEHTKHSPDEYKYDIFHPAHLLHGDVLCSVFCSSFARIARISFSIASGYPHANLYFSCSSRSSIPVFVRLLRCRMYIHHSPSPIKFRKHLPHFGQYSMGILLASPVSIAAPNRVNTIFSVSESHSYAFSSVSGF